MLFYLVRKVHELSEEWEGIDHDSVAVRLLSYQHWFNDKITWNFNNCPALTKQNQTASGIIRVTASARVALLFRGQYRARSVACEMRTDTSRDVGSGSSRAVVAHLTSVHAPHDTRIFHKECKSLHKAGYDVCLVAPDSEDKIVDGIKILSIPKERSRFRRFLLSPWRVFRRALESRAHVVHFHDPELIPVGILLRLLGRKVIYDVHEDVSRQILSKDWIKPWLRHLVAAATARNHASGRSGAWVLA